MDCNPVYTSTVLEKMRAFDELVKGYSILEMEMRPAHELKDVIQRSGLANLVIPTHLGGQGCTLHELLYVLHRAAQSSPSLSIMLCMHYHVVATLAQFPEAIPSASTLLTTIAKDNKLLASAFSEGVPGMSIFDSSVRGTSTDSGIAVNGSKQPCSMSSVADYYAVSMSVDDKYAGIAIINKEAGGISNEAFWPSELLQAADSNRVIFDNVYVDKSSTLVGEPHELEALLAYGLAGFNLMINAAYTGCACALAKKLPEVASQNVPLFMDIKGQLLTAFYAGLGHVKGLSNLTQLETSLHNILLTRFQSQNIIKNTVSMINENIGAFSFLADAEVVKLGAICNLMTFHPVSRYQFSSMLLHATSKE